MSEQLCVCGKVRSEHFPFWFRGTNDCQNFRPVLDWPDSAGLWWNESGVEEINEELELWSGYTGTWISRTEHEKLYDKFKFVKLTEQNPFTARAT